MADASSIVSGAAPKRDSTGICRASAAQSASIVWMRSRTGLSSMRQSSRRSRSTTARARASVRASCGPSGCFPARASASAASTRPRISPAALMVNVIATISSGDSTVASSAR